MKLITYLGGRNPAPDALTLGAAAETFTEGEALTFNTSGYLTKASGTNEALFVAVESKTVATAGEGLRIIKVDGNMLFEADAAGAVTAGKKYTIDADGTGITATATSGVVLVIKGTSAAGKALVCLA